VLTAVWMKPKIRLERLRPCGVSDWLPGEFCGGGL
jgi:hypothetical protein